VHNHTHAPCSPLPPPRCGQEGCFLGSGYYLVQPISWAIIANYVPAQRALEGLGVRERMGVIADTEREKRAWGPMRVLADVVIVSVDWGAMTVQWYTLASAAICVGFTTSLLYMCVRACMLGVRVHTHLWTDRACTCVRG
jgi:hypothetical protein